MDFARISDDFFFRIVMFQLKNMLWGFNVIYRQILGIV